MELRQQLYPDMYRDNVEDKAPPQHQESVFARHYQEKVDHEKAAVWLRQVHYKRRKVLPPVEMTQCLDDVAQVEGQTSTRESIVWNAHAVVPH